MVPFILIILNLFFPTKVIYCRCWTRETSKLLEDSGPWFNAGWNEDINYPLYHYFRTKKKIELKLCTLSACPLGNGRGGWACIMWWEGYSESGSYWVVVIREIYTFNMQIKLMAFKILSSKEPLFLKLKNKRTVSCNLILAWQKKCTDRARP